MKNLLISIFLLTAFPAFTQNDSLVYLNLEYDQNNRIVFSEVIQVDGVSKKELFNRARKWFADYYNSSETVIDLEDKESGILIAKPLGYANIPYILGFTAVKMFYTINIYVKDGRYKYEITDIINETDPSEFNGYRSSKTNIESVINDYMVFKPNGKIREKSKNWKVATIKMVYKIADDLVESMNNSVVDSDHDW